MRLDMLAELMIEAVELSSNDFMLAERVKELVAEHKYDLAELEDLTDELGCDGGACTL